MAKASLITPLEPRHIPAAHRLNQEFAAELSNDSNARFTELVGLAVYARAVGNVDAFLLAFDESTPIQGENHGWFNERYRRFLYIDRVAVAAELQGRGLARRLYDEVLAWARTHGYPIVGCEVNVRPANPRSLAFHRALGFTEVAERELSNGRRVVYLVRPVTRPIGLPPVGAALSD